MNCTIDAWIENGVTHLQIIDRDSGAMRLDWSWQDPAASGISEMHEHCAARGALQRLVGDLFLLACIDGMRANRRSDPRPEEKRTAREHYPDDRIGITASAA